VPRAGWVKPQTDQRLSDHISIGMLTWAASHFTRLRRRQFVDDTIPSSRECRDSLAPQAETRRLRPPDIVLAANRAAFGSFAQNG